MRILAEWGRRIWFLLNRPKLERELEREMAAHREMMNDPRRFGNALKLREEARAVWGWNWLDRICQDARYGSRVLRKSPGFTLASVLILSLGIGLNLAFFQIVNVTLLQPLPVRDLDTLVRFYRHEKYSQSSGVPYPATQFFRHHNNVLSAVLTQTRSDVAWGDDAADRLRAAFVSANFFHELGYGAAQGRVFHEPHDERPDAPPVVVLGHDFWQRRLNADPRVIGQTVRLNNRPATVIGVAPLSFPGLRLDNPQVWMPIHQIDYFNPGSKFMDAWDSNNTEMYGRLLSGVHAAAARDGMRAAVRELARQQPNAFRDGEWLEPHLGSVRFQRPKDLQEIWTVTLLVGSLTLLVLLVACSNLGSLVLSRANYRMREFSVRTALGAGRWRVTQQLLTESLLLSFCGFLGGLLLGQAAAKLLAARIELPPHLNFTPDWRTLVAALGFSLFSVVLFGLVPAWKTSRHDLTSAIKEGSPQGSGGLQRSRFQQILVAAQVALFCSLLLV